MCLEDYVMTEQKSRLGLNTVLYVTYAISNDRILILIQAIDSTDGRQQRMTTGILNKTRLEAYNKQTDILTSRPFCHVAMLAQKL